jgi:methylthioribulose-1-phosphate dehydratase
VVAVTAEPTADEVREVGARLAAEAARFAARGWMQATAGNLSEVVRTDPLRLVVTSSGVDKATMAAADVVVVDAAGQAVAIDGLEPRRPSAEAELHAHVAATRGAGAVVHVHALAPVIAAERFPQGIPLDRIEMVKAFGHDAESCSTVPVIANSQSMAELAVRLDAAAPAVPGVVVARHGMYAWGDSLLQARHHAEGLEWALAFVVATTGGGAPSPSPDHGEAPS